MRNKIILVSKDAMGKFYLPTYGNNIWSTPNIDALAQKGTVFTRFYTAAPSSAMSYTAMFTGSDLFETQRKDFRAVKNENLGETLFDKAKHMGFSCHVIWDEKWMGSPKLFSECYGEQTTFHPIVDLQQCVGPHFPHKGELMADDSKTQKAVDKLMKEIQDIDTHHEQYFIWLHLPHSMNGRTCYGSDTDVLDSIIGKIRDIIPDDGIYITADHGNMNGCKGKICYGFDVYEPAICIPLITPLIGRESKCTFPVSNKDMYSLIFDRVIPRRDFVYCDSAYYAQPARKLAIIHGKYKYIYNAKNKTEELYDLEYDSNENVNLITHYIFDTDRHLQTDLKEVYFYPYWDEIETIKEIMRTEKARIWRNPSLIESFQGRSMTFAKNCYKSMRRILRKVRAQ